MDQAIEGNIVDGISVGYKSGEAGLEAGNYKDNDEDVFYEDFYIPGKLAQYVDYVPDLGIRLAWQTDATEEQKRSWFVLEDIHL